MNGLINGKGILSNHFYHKTTIFYSSVFLSLLSNITIKRDDGKIIKLPVGFTNSQKYNVANQQDLNLANDDVPRTGIQLPRLGAKFVGWKRDETRVRNKQYKLSGNKKEQLERVPYNLSYDVTIKTQYLSDMFQIMEQLLVVFNPSVEVVIKDNPDLDAETSITVTLAAGNFNDVVETSIGESRVIESTLSFTVDGWLYMPTHNEYGIIKKVVIDYNDKDTKEFLAETIVEGEKITLEARRGYE